MKNNRFIVWLLTLALILSALPLGSVIARESESIDTTPTTTSQSSAKGYGWDVLVTMGQAENTLLFTWTTNGNGNERVELAEASKMENGKFPKEFLSFPAVDITNEVCSATAADLKPDTEYCYRVANSTNTYSEVYTVSTHANDGEFSFILAGDPQIGATGDFVDVPAWELTLDKAREWFGSDIEFLMSAGDQTNNSLEQQFNGYATPEYLRNTPMLSVPGNHDNVSNAVYSKHFIYQNVDQKTVTEAGIYGGDYWVAYDGALIMGLNMNNLSYSLHAAFMQTAISEYTELYGEPTWKIVTFHQSLFSAAGGRWEESSRRNGLAPYLSKLGIDAVLMGHDHVYTRAYMMNGTTPITDESRYTEMKGDPYGSMVDPKEGEVFYITANSSTGSKYYDLHTGSKIPYVAYANQENTPNITKVDVTTDSLVFTTYRTSAKNEFDDVVDTFAIRRTTTEDKHAPTITVPEKTYYIADENYDLLKGVTAYDNVDGDVTDKIEITGKLDLYAESVITYTVTDAQGNTAKVKRIMIPYIYQTPVTAESQWQYLDDGSIPFENNDDLNWATSEYDDSQWNTGVGPFGARDGELSEHDGIVPNTLISQYFPEGSEDWGANIPSFFFRATFDLENPEAVTLMGGDFYYDDAMFVYINGVLIDGFHTVNVSDKADYGWQESPGDATPGSFKMISKEYIKTLNLKEKGNVIAVQLFQASAYSDDIFFHLDSLYFGSIPEKEEKEMPFTDVKESAWYYESVSRAYNDGLFVGTTDTTFAPRATMTRAAVWTVLARIAGADVSVSSGKWYAAAQKWAMDNGVSDGTMPNSAITREQFAKMLWSMQGEPETANSLASFADGAKVSSWAREGLSWAVNQGLIEGRSGNKLAPKDNASRAEACTLLLRYIDM